MQIHDELGIMYMDEDFATLSGAVGQPAETSWQLALVNGLCLFAVQI